ncbi:hypothetical protein ACFXTH_003594 [Malus domestica]
MFWKQQSHWVGEGVSEKAKGGWFLERKRVGHRRRITDSVWALIAGKNWRRCASLRVSESGLASLQWLRKGKVAMVGVGKGRMRGRGESKKGR